MNEQNIVSLTVDVETDWGGRLGVSTDTCHGVERGLPVILDVFDRYNIKGTFFISSPLLETHKSYIQSIHQKGHEIASHGHKHDIPYDSLSSKQLSEQVSKSKRMLEDLTGQSVKGFRVPQFRASNNLFSILEDEGYLYDSSISPVFFPNRYNKATSNLLPHRKGNIVEIPVSRFPYVPIPVGLLWINLIGFSIYKRFFIIKKKSHQTVMYLHPFDMIEQKSKYNGKLTVKLWYNLKNNTIFQTLISFVEFHLNNKASFRTLSEISEGVS